MREVGTVADDVGLNDRQHRMAERAVILPGRITMANTAEPSEGHAPADSVAVRSASSSGTGLAPTRRPRIVPLDVEQHSVERAASTACAGVCGLTIRQSGHVPRPATRPPETLDGRRRTRNRTPVSTRANSSRSGHRDRRYAQSRQGVRRRRLRVARATSPSCSTSDMLGGAELLLDGVLRALFLLVQRLEHPVAERTRCRSA